VPIMNGKLRGDDGGATARAVLEDFEEIGCCRRWEGPEREVIDDEDVDSCPGGEDTWEPSITPGDGEVVEKARRAEVECRVPGADSCVREGAGEERLFRAGGADDENVLAGGDPLRRGKREDGGAVKPPRTAEVEVLHAGIDAELR